MTEDDFIKSLIEKVFIGAVAAVVSAFALHAYNLHAKSFEGAQVQLRSISSVSINSKNLIVESIGKIRTVTREQLVSKDHNVAQRVLNDTNNVAAGAATLQMRMPNSAKIAKELAEKAYNDFYKIFVQSTAVTVSEFNIRDDRVVTLQVSFLDKFDEELSHVLSDEFDRAYNRYYDAAKWYQNPTVLASIALALSLAVGLGYIFLRPGR